MKIDLSAFDVAYEALAEDIIHKIKKAYPKYDIKFIRRHYTLGDDIIPLYINNNKFSFNLMEYLDECHDIGEDYAFNELQIKIQQLLQNLHN